MNRDDTSAFQTMFLDFKKDVKDDFKDVKSSIDSVQRSVSILGKDVSIIQTTLTTHGKSIDDLKAQVHCDKNIGFTAGGWVAMVKTAFYGLTTIVTIGAGIGAAFYTCSGGKF